MTDAQALPVTIAVAALLLALFAGWRSGRRRRRADPDAVGFVDWTTVQMVALLVMAAAWFAARA
jgi:hypothetical protein